MVVVSPQPKTLTEGQIPNKRKITPSLFPQGTFPGSQLRIGKQTAFPKNSYKFRDSNEL